MKIKDNNDIELLMSRRQLLRLTMIMLTVFMITLTINFTDVLNSQRFDNIFNFPACRSKIKQLQDKLSRCRTLLHCNRADLKVHWQEGLECSEKLNLLDKM